MDRRSIRSRLWPGWNRFDQVIFLIPAAFEVDDQGRFELGAVTGNVLGQLYRFDHRLPV